MAHSSSALVVASGIFNLVLAVFHLTFWRLFRWPESLNALGHVNRQILYVLNWAVTALFVLTAYLLICYTPDVLGTRLGGALLWGMTVFWLARAALQPVMFGLTKSLSILMFLVFLLGAGLHGSAALSRNAI